jgi:hypothetical protein
LLLAVEVAVEVHLNHQTHKVVLAEHLMTVIEVVMEAKLGVRLGLVAEVVVEHLSLDKDMVFGKQWLALAEVAEVVEVAMEALVKWDTSLVRLMTITQHGVIQLAHGLQF